MKRLTPMVWLSALFVSLAAMAEESWPVVPALQSPDAARMAQLRAGDILLENTDLNESGGSALVMAYFDGTAEDVWTLLGDCEANFRFVDGLRECELLESDSRRALTRQSVKKHFLIPRLDYEFETAREPMQWVAIRLVSGDLKAMHGSWRFDPVPGESSMIVTHRIHVQPSIPAPRWLVRRTLRNDIGDMVACLRSISRASPSAEILAADRKRCP